jgi:hypothetical protein
MRTKPKEYKWLRAEELPAKIEALKKSGRFFTIAFQKDTKEYRVMNGKVNAFNRLAGGTTPKKAEGKFTMFDAQKDGFRTANMNTAYYLRADGIEYAII